MKLIKPKGETRWPNTLNGPRKAGAILIGGELMYTFLRQTEREAKSNAADAFGTTWRKMQHAGYRCHRVLVIDPEQIEEAIRLFNDGEWQAGMEKLLALTGRKSPLLDILKRGKPVSSVEVAARPECDFTITPCKPKNSWHNPRQTRRSTNVRRIIQVQYELPCNKWMCGRCGEISVVETCTMFGGAVRKKDGKGRFLRLPACIAADTDLEPCEAGCRREATYTDGKGSDLCTPCWNALIKEAKAEHDAKAAMDAAKE